MNVPHANNEAGNQGMEVPELYEFEDKDWPEPEKGFAAMLRNIDRDTGLILDFLQRLGIAERTLVIFTSDNGPHQEGGHRADFFNSMVLTAESNATSMRGRHPSAHNCMVARYHPARYHE